MRTKYEQLKHRLSNLEITLSILLLLTPVILMIVTGEERSSISDYAYSEKSRYFVFLLTLAGTMFLFNGSATKKWYNTILGVSLIGVSLTPHNNTDVVLSFLSLDITVSLLHYIFATIFFLGSCFVMSFFSSKKERWYKIVAGIIIVLGLAGSYFGLYSLLYAEWIGMLPITAHFIAESIGKIN